MFPSLCLLYQVLAVGVAGVGTAPGSNETLRRVASPPQAINNDDCLAVRLFIHYVPLSVGSIRS